MYIIDYSNSNPNYSASTQEDGSLLVTVDLPGVTKDDVQLSHSTHRLDFTYTREDEQTKTRSLNIGTRWDVSKAKATMKDGVLKITIPQISKSKIKVE